MKRREFITLLGGAAAAWPLAARAQQEPSPIRPLIGLLVPLSATAATRNVAAFQSALRDDGYVAGRNVTLELRYGEGALERLAPLVSELIALKPDVLFTGGKAGALAVHSVTQAIPIVIVTPEDPVVSGLANTIAKPGEMSPGHGFSGTTHWWGSGSNYSGAQSRPSPALASSPIPTTQATA